MTEELQEVICIFPKTLQEESIFAKNLRHARVLFKEKYEKVPAGMVFRYKKIKIYDLNPKKKFNGLFK